VVAATATSIAGSEVSLVAHQLVAVLAVDPRPTRGLTTPRSMTKDVPRPGVNDEIVLGIESPGRETHASTYESSLQNVHVGDQVNVTLSGGEPTSSR